LRPLDLAIAHTPQNSDTTVYLSPNTTEDALTLAEYLERNYMAKLSQSARTCCNDTLQGSVDERVVTEIQALLNTEKVTITQVMTNKSYVTAKNLVIADLTRQMHLNATSLQGTNAFLKEQLVSKGIIWEAPANGEAKLDAKATWKKFKRAHRATVSVV
jgi:hypothetical protein